MRTNTKRVALPFLFRAADCIGANGQLIARAYGAEVAAVFTRAGIANTADDTGRVVVAPYGVPRLGVVGGHHALTLEAAATNLVLYSEDFSNAAWTKGYVTSNALTAGGISLALLSDADPLGPASASQTVTYTGNGSKVISTYAVGGTSALSVLQLFDATAAVIRTNCTVTWTAGVPTLAITSGSGTALPVESLGGGLYRLSFIADNVVAANTNTIALYGTDPGAPTDSGTVYFGGVQSQNAITPSSYVKTTTVAVTRVADSLYFPFTLTPRAMTVYVRGVVRENASAVPPVNYRLWQIGNDSNADPRLMVYRDTSSAGWVGFHDPATSTNTSAVGTTATIGDLVELRLVLASTGAVTVGASVNGGAESTSGPSTAQALAAAWSATRLYLNGFGSTIGLFAFTHVAVALGTKTLAEMRELAEVI